ncbi:hypothetical protein R3P38DRAFT_3274621 [Favolaschia claudopus]|uniref:Membrane-associated protein n=1 Tax=Favolaschia claudopus TaxID=2862362 RepID=A0AAW0B249_9AGAR
MPPFTLASSPSARAFSPSAVAVLTFVIVGLVVLSFAVALVYSFVVPSVMRLVRRAPVEDEENFSDSIVIISGPEKSDSPTPVLVDNKTDAPHPRSPLARLTVEVNTASRFGSLRTRTSPGPSRLRKCMSLETIQEEEEQVISPVHLVEVNMTKSDADEEGKDKAIKNKFLIHPHLLPIGETPARFGTARRTAFVSRPSPLHETSNICNDDAAPITTDVEAFSIAESIAVALANPSSSDFIPISEDMIDDEDENPFVFDIGRPVPPPAPFIDVPTIIIVDTDLVQAPAPAPQRIGRQRSNSFMGMKHSQTVYCARGGQGSTKQKEKENTGYLQVPSAEPPKSKRSSRRRAVASNTRL